MRFQATIQSAGKTATGIVIPDEVVESLGAGKKPPIRVTLNGHTYRSTVARRGDRYLVGVSAVNRERAGVAAGDELEVQIELDSEPREVDVPADFARALDGDPKARGFFDGLTHSQKQWFVVEVESAKKAETREKRIAKFVGMLQAGRKR